MKEMLALYSAAELRQKARDWLARTVMNRAFRPIQTLRVRHVAHSGCPGMSLEPARCGNATVRGPQEGLAFRCGSAGAQAELKQRTYQPGPPASPRLRAFSFTGSSASKDSAK